MFRTTNNWLSKRAEAEIQRTLGDLVKDDRSWYKKALSYVAPRNKWWISVIFAVFVCYIITYLGFDSLNFFRIESQTIYTIVDQRTANLATIISITLVVITLLINNIAVKSTLTYDLLFTKMFFYPIVYLTLTTIGCLVVASTLRDEIDPERFSRIVIAETYLVLFILILIGYLFRTITLFTDEKKVMKMLGSELILEEKKKLRKILIKRISKRIYSEILLALQIRKFDPWANLAIENIEVLRDNEKQKEVEELLIVVDVNVDRIEKMFAGHNNSNWVYKDLGIGEVLSSRAKLIWQRDDGFTTPQINEAFVLDIKKNTTTDDSTLRDYFKQRLDELVEKGESEKLDDLLKTYLNVYELQMIADT